MIYKLNGTDITNKQFTTLNGNQYPSNWISLSKEEDILNLGIIILNEIYPEISGNEYYDGTFIDTDVDRIYNIVDPDNI